MIPSYPPVTQTFKQSTSKKPSFPSSTPKLNHLVTFCVAELHEKAAIVRSLSDICKGWRVRRLLRALHLRSHNHGLVMLGAGKRMRQRHKKIREEKSLLVILFASFFF